MRVGFMTIDKHSNSETDKLLLLQAFHGFLEAGFQWNVVNTQALCLFLGHLVGWHKWFIVCTPANFISKSIKIKDYYWIPQKRSEKP